ncbi:sugar transferase [soil metagenome]
MDIGIQPVRKLAIRNPSRFRKPLSPFRIVELALSLAALLFLLPLMVLIAALIRLESRGPALFRQDRVGKSGKMFACLKFRSMAADATDRLNHLLAADPAARREWELTQKLRNDPRITRIGRFLRKSSLDEVPQLINVVRGEMSLIGPRPIIPAEVRNYGRHINTYHRVRPGISGLWQISGRSDTSYRRRVACDVLYVRRKSFGLDMKITIATLPAVLLSRGAR